MSLIGGKLALGTAQFGMKYGITNHGGRPDEPSIERILDRAFVSGIDLLDTANAYGESEELIGRLLAAQPFFKIVTKTRPLGVEKIGSSEIFQLKEGIDQSFLRLKRDSIYGILVHHAHELLLPGGHQIFSILEALKQDNRIEKIGVSAYSPEIVKEIIRRYNVDLVQVPFNLLDQRMLKSGLFTYLKNAGVEIHVRSAFLQGALLSDIRQLPTKFNVVGNQFSLIEDLMQRLGISRMALALGFLKRQPEIDRIIIGVLNEQQLFECIEAWNTDFSEETDFGLFECNNISIIDPSKW